MFFNFQVQLNSLTLINNLLAFANVYRWAYLKKLPHHLVGRPKVGSFIPYLLLLTDWNIGYFLNQFLTGHPSHDKQNTVLRRLWLWLVKDTVSGFFGPDCIKVSLWKYAVAPASSNYLAVCHWREMKIPLLIIKLNQCWGSVTFWCGSRSVSLTNGSGSGSDYFFHWF